MRPVIAAMPGIAPEQKRNASPERALGCSDVACPALLSPTVASRQTATAKTKPAAPKMEEKFLIMAVLLAMNCFCSRMGWPEDASRLSQAL
jgi:hypothetical protein